MGIALAPTSRGTSQVCLSRSIVANRGETATGGHHHGCKTTHRRRDFPNSRRLQPQPLAGRCRFLHRAEPTHPGLVRAPGPAYGAEPAGEIPAVSRREAAAGRQPAGSLVLAHRHQRAARRIAIRQNRGHQGQRLRGRRSHDERHQRPGGLRPRRRRHHRHPYPGRWRRHQGQGGLREPVLLRRQPHVRYRTGPQPT